MSSPAAVKFEMSDDEKSVDSNISSVASTSVKKRGRPSTGRTKPSDSARNKATQVRKDFLKNIIQRIESNISAEPSIFRRGAKLSSDEQSMKEKIANKIVNSFRGKTPRGDHAEEFKDDPTFIDENLNRLKADNSEQIK